MSKSYVLPLLLILILATPAVADDVWVDAMDLAIRLDPPKHRIEGTATLVLAPARTGPAALTFRLHAGLKITPPEGVTFEKNEVSGWWRVLTVSVPPAMKELVLRYEGTIYDAVDKSDALSFVVGDDTRGVIGDEGVFLVSGSGWYPATDGIVRFRKIEVDGPGDWRVVTQGRQDGRKVEDGREHTVWTNERPMDGLALQAGNYVVTTRDVNGTKISTYLFPEEQKHSKLFLDESQRYIEFYTPILGPYPWPKFDIVENFFTTGYGMPSFTLLGQKVMPVMVMMAARNKGQIPPGYIDHEMVHCWWGNYVYPDYESGNWCEGLTSWYSNYLMKDATDPALALAHRKKISTNFAIRVTSENDYPVREFRGKTEDFENDIGYGKASMIFHMLATRVGYETYFETMRGIVRDHGGKRTSWEDFERAFSKAAGEDLSWYFDQWLTRTGAPRLGISPVTVTRGKDGLFRISAEILQEGKPWRLRVPVTVDHVGGEVYKEFDVADAKTPFTIVSPRMPVSVAIDERFHLFRHVPMDEIQPCLNLTLERPEKVFVVPEGDAAYARLAGMAQGRKGGEIVTATDALPESNFVAFGRPEANPAVAKVLAAANVTVEGNAITIRGKKYEGEDLWVLLSTRHPEAADKFATVYFGMTEKALGRSFIIFHYGWDGHLIYQGRRPLTRGDFTKITPRTVRMIPIEADAGRIEKTVKMLASPEMEGRRTGSEGSLATFEYLHDELSRTGVDRVMIARTTFIVRDWDDPDAWSVAQGKLADGKTEWKTSYPGAVVPAVFSREAKDGVRIERIVMFPEKADAKSLLVLPPVRSPESLLTLLASLVDSPAAAIAIPMEVLTGKDRRFGDLAAYPSHFPGKMPAVDPWRNASGRQARAIRPPFDMPMPVVFLDSRILPPGGTGPAMARLRVTFTNRQMTALNLEARITPPGSEKRPMVGLMAHWDGCGEGHPSADDNASGVAALLETCRALAARKALLTREVRILFPDSEEWGLRGSASLAHLDTKRTGVMVNLDSVGAADQPDAYVIGRSHYPHLSARAIACLMAEGFPIGRDIDRFAFDQGSDHWSFHRRGVPSIDLWSSQYRRMNTKDDTLDKVDFEKIARISRATTRLALDLATER